MEETVPTIHTSMVQRNIFFMTENDERFYGGFHRVGICPTAAPRQGRGRL